MLTKFHFQECKSPNQSSECKCECPSCMFTNTSAKSTPAVRVKIITTRDVMASWANIIVKHGNATQSHEKLVVALQTLGQWCFLFCFLNSQTNRCQ